MFKEFVNYLWTNVKRMENSILGVYHNGKGLRFRYLRRVELKYKKNNKYNENRTSHFTRSVYGLQ